MDPQRTCGCHIFVCGNIIYSLAARGRHIRFKVNVATVPHFVEMFGEIYTPHLDKTDLV